MHRQTRQAGMRAGLGAVAARWVNLGRFALLFVLGLLTHLVRPFSHEALLRL
jgi:hypothetical protein